MITPLARQQALLVEAAELDAWRDMYRAMPAAFREQYGAEILEIGDTLLTCSAGIPFVHFNAVLNLGLQSPATEATLDAVVAAYRGAGVQRFTIVGNPFAEPSRLGDWLRARGGEPRRGWDRVCRFGSPAAAAPPPARGDIVFVTADTAADWASFLDGWYRLPTSPWLQSLVGRAGWRHAMLRREGRIVAARSLFVQPRRHAWLGVEAPVPGLMAPSFEDDHCLLHALLAEATLAQVEVVAADVEACTVEHAGPAYDRWRALQFLVAYHRPHFVHAA